LSGRTSAVIGTHTHVQTSDERVLPGGTAYITDAGMTGVRDSVLGLAVESVIQKFITQIPNKFTLAEGPAVLSGVMMEIDPSTGHATGIRRIAESE
jgi:calcineurin-like phosphoesterase